MVAFVAGAVLTAANLNASLNQLTIRAVTTTSDTLLLADQGGAVSFSNASPITATIPPNSSVAFAVGTKIVLINLGAGVVTVTAGVGVTVNGATLTLAQNAGGTCIKTATNTWSFLPFSSGVGAANFSDTATGTYTGFKYKTFTASGTITVTTAGFADLVVQGGGGAGGRYASPGGGGAGGCFNRASTSVYLPVGTHTVTVGAGGAGSTTVNEYAGAGTESSLGFYSAMGGGGGGSGQGGYPSIGGCGGGGGSSTTAATRAGALGSPVNGNNGGSGLNGTYFAGGGGGGVGAVGVDAAASAAGAGGAGTTTTIAGTTPSGAYVAGSYAFGGGGGGAGYSVGGYTSGAGGSGGGGAGSSTVSGTNGTVNTGGGGGGTDDVGSTYQGGNGGSGIVIVRVAV